MLEVRDQRITKPYLGGWRHTVTGVIYYNAASQTGPLQKSNVGKLCSREVQCIDITNDACQTSVHVATQMWRRDCYISSKADKCLTAKPYVSFEELQTQLNRKASIIQRCYRSWRSRKTIEEPAPDFAKWPSDCRTIEEHQEKLQNLQSTCPRSRAEFQKIYTLIGRWRCDRFDAARETLFEASRKAENYRILQQTVEMLRNVEKHRFCNAEERIKKKLTNFLSYHCRPVKWTSTRGKSMEMVTLRVQKARELKSFYEKLCRRDCTVRQRIETLVLLLKSLDSHSCSSAIELLSLIDQELVLLCRNIEGLSLENLSKRVSDERSKDLELFEPPGERLFCLCCKRLNPPMESQVHATTKKLICRVCALVRQKTMEN